MRLAIKIALDIFDSQAGLGKHLLDAFSAVELDGFVDDPLTIIGDNSNLLFDAAIIGNPAVLLDEPTAIGVSAVRLKTLTKVRFINIVQPKNAVGLEGLAGLLNNGEVLLIGLEVSKRSKQQGGAGKLGLEWQKTHVGADELDLRGERS